jgi:hypothetical protein
MPQTADLLPTILDLAGVPQPEGLDGRSLLDERSASDPRVVFSSLRLDESRFEAASDGRWKLLVAPNSREEWLYDLEADPGEQQPRSPPYNGEWARARSRLGSALAEVSPPPEGRGAREKTPPPEIPENARRALEALGYLD